MRPRNYCYIETPSGRRFHGTYPHNLNVARGGEAPYIAELAHRVQGLAEVTLPAGRADVANCTDVYEVEPVRSWKHGAQQAYAYGAMSGLRPNLALFGKADFERIYLTVRDKMPGMTLWLYHPIYGWQRTTSRIRARRKIAQAAE